VGADSVKAEYLRSYDYRILVGIVICFVLAIEVTGLLSPNSLRLVQHVPLESKIPLNINQWQAIGTTAGNPMLVVGGNSTDQPYDQVLYRAYQNPNGNIVVLAIAWGQNQRQEVKIHRPELCYEAQGFHVSNLHPINIVLKKGRAESLEIPGQFLVGTARESRQAIAYWIRIGQIFSQHPIETRLHLIREGLAGRMPDGVLVRASTSISNDESDLMAQARLLEFLNDLAGALSDDMRVLILGHMADREAEHQR